MKNQVGGIISGIRKRIIGMDLPQDVQAKILEQVHIGRHNISIPKDVSKRIARQISLDGHCVVSKSQKMWCVYSVIGWNKKAKNLINLNGKNNENV